MDGYGNRMQTQTTQKETTMTRQIGYLVFAVALALAGTWTVFNLCENVGADEIVVKQAAFSGELTFWTTPGVHSQGFGSLTRYRKSAQYWFSAAHDQGEGRDQSIKVRFNDGGHANVSGSLRFDLPTDAEHLTALHTKFGSQGAIQQQLIRTVVERSVYMSGPLMSSKESTAERRSDLIQYIEDQVKLGVFKTETEETKVQDPLSGKDKTVSRVKLVRDEKSPNGIARQEKSSLEEFGIRTYNFTIDGVAYDADVEKQIKEQQQMLMQVQTAMAGAKQAEQKAITAAKEGEAEAMKAKWAQEVLKAKAVTAAEQARAVAELTVKTAELTKQAQILEGEGEAAKKKLVMAADGALEKKLAAFVEVNKAYAAEMGKQRWVPEVQMGGAGVGGGSAAAGLMEMWQAKAARDLALDMRIVGAARPAPAK
jgi:hypothetical protein